MTPKISVVITTYNRAQKLRRAIDSVINQTFKEWEIVLVDDASSDETPEVAKEYLEKLGDQLNYVRCEENFGQHTRPKNIGTREAKAELIAYLDDDNAYRADHLQALYKNLNEEVDGVYGTRMIVDEAGKYPNSVGITGPFSVSRLVHQNYIDTSDVLIQKTAILGVGGWDENLPKYADWNLWLRMGKAGKKLRQVNLILTDYYVHEGMNQLKTKFAIDPVTGREGPGFDAAGCPIWAGKTIFGEEPALNVAVFSLTYDRLEYTKRSFASMKELAGYEFDHFVIDNNSQDGTKEWLKNEFRPFHLTLNDKNRGISAASNQALEAIGEEYDIILKVDNDCEFLTEGWLKSIVEIFRRSRLGVCSPYVEGLIDNPGGVPRQRMDDPRQSPYGYIGNELIGFAPHLGGICIAAPKAAYKNFRWRDHDFLHGIQDVEFSQHCGRKGLVMFYLENIKVNHIDTRLGQEKRFPDYFERRKKEKITTFEG